MQPILPGIQHPPTDRASQGRPVRYFALACDYDGTIARAGCVADSTLQALRRLKASGRKIILVTGRRLDDLRTVFPQLGVFDRIVAENGALLYNPEVDEMRLLATPPPAAFVATLRARGVSPLEAGECIVATCEPNDAIVLTVIRDMGLELQMIYNKGAVMILPSGINKSTGVLGALAELGMSPHNTVAVGDAENDHALLERCALGVAVANAIASLREQGDMITESADGKGVEELIDGLLKNGLREVPDRRGRSRILLGVDGQGAQVFIPYQANLLIAGPSASGKSTIVHGLLERMLECRFQVCLVDPEGDYEQVDGVISLGTPSRAPELSEVLKALEDPFASVVVNLLGISLPDRPQFFGELLLRLQEMRARTGRPHWIIFDEAHHLMPADWLPATQMPDQMPELNGLIMVTVHPEAVSPAAIQSICGIVAVGANPEKTVEYFHAQAGWAAPAGDFQQTSQETDKVIVWFRDEGIAPRLISARPPQKEMRRHKRKYAAGQLGDDKSFYFRGVEDKLNLQANNLAMFIQIAKGVDDDTWTHHLRRHDYSVWLRTSIKDEDLASEVARVEDDRSMSAQESRSRIFAALQEKYTADEGKRTT